MNAVAYQVALVWRDRVGKRRVQRSGNGLVRRLDIQFIFFVLSSICRSMGDDAIVETSRGYR